MIQNSHGFPGVTRYRNGSFGSSLMVNGVRRFLGTFATAKAAAEAYERAKAPHRRDVGPPTGLSIKALIHYDPATGEITKLSTARKAAVKPGKYVHVSLRGRVYRAHRLAFLYMTGEWPTHTVDHINGEPSDNRWLNLRDVPQKVNQQNLRRPKGNNATGLLGVRASRSGIRWIAEICIDGKTRRIGTFDTPQAAHAAYLEAKRANHKGCTL